MDDRVFSYESCVFCYGLDLTVQAAPKRASFHRDHLCSEKGAPGFPGLLSLFIRNSTLTLGSRARSFLT